MGNIIVAPGRYIQGKGEIKNLGTHISALGRNAMIITSKSGKARIEKAMEGSTEDNFNYIFEPFNGECSMPEIERLMHIFKEKKCDLIVGAGGGKVLDTAKAIACLLKVPNVIVPTAISSDAPCSALAVIYHEDGSLDHRFPLPKSPDVVLVDSAIIAQCPVKLSVAGMGDALSTYFESRACMTSGSLNIHGGHISLLGHQIARLCFDILMRDGVKAKHALEEHVCTQAVENIIEANTLLSGIGFESGGKGAAHAINDGFAALEACHHVMHGEKVAFGTLVQLIMENVDNEELNQVYKFCMDVGLPITLSELGIVENIEENVRHAAQVATLPGESIFNMPMEITEEKVYDAILGADIWGRQFIAGQKDIVSLQS
ncbi:MAG: glycerol dehydrogenase [Clostridia bacterium BRH_c25]|nr:MAG: glycerol dehydrogenase [Clostridia bacterium BRH_c25]